MAKQQKPIDKMTKPELLKLVKTLQKRVAKLEAQLADATPPRWKAADAQVITLCAECTTPRVCGSEGKCLGPTKSAASMFPWQTVLENTKGL